MIALNLAGQQLKKDLEKGYRMGEDVENYFHGGTKFLLANPRGASHSKDADRISRALQHGHFLMLHHKDDVYYLTF
jgi:hypothetical protein